MLRSLVHSAREHFTGRYVLSLVVFLAVVYGVTQDIGTVTIVVETI